MYNIYMTYLLSVLSEKPQGLWMMDDTTPFQDYSGYGRAGVINAGTATTAAALVAGAAFSQVFSNSNNAKFDSPVYVQGYESQAFSLEASIRLIDESGAPAVQKILSTTSNYDGLTVNGTVIGFSTQYLTAGTCLASYDIQTKRNVHIVGVHTNDKNQLYVDGVLVAETLMTVAQKADSYVATDGKLYLGFSTSTQKVAVNGLAVYSSPLNPIDINNHFLAARRTILADSIPQTFGGARIPLNIERASRFLRTTWDTLDDWNLGTVNQVSVVDGRLVPSLVAGVSVAGDWQAMVPLDYGLTSVYGVFLDWDSLNATVQISLDATTWETVVKRTKTTTIPDTFNPTGKDLFIKVSFAGGITDDPGYVDYLTITGLTTGTIPMFNTRTVTFTTPAAPMNDYEPIAERDDFGIKLGTGTLTLSADTQAINVNTISIWLKKLTATNPTISVAGTAYKNGAVGGTLNQGEWAMYTITATAPITGTITISGDIQLGQVEIYDAVLSAQQIADLYAASVGVPILPAPDADVLTITNPNPSTRLYDYVWSISPAG